MQTTKARCDALIQDLVTLSARIAAAEYRQLELIRAIEDAIVLEHDPFPTWLAWRLGIALSTAYERIRVARALAVLPAISAAFADGRLSYSKVRLVAAVATPETDVKYAALALEGGVRYLEAVVRQHTTIMHAQSEEIERKRYFQLTVDDDGMVIVRGRLAPDEGALLKKALDAAKTATNADTCQAVAQVATAAVDRLATGDELTLHVQNEPHICAVEGHACSRATADRLICQNPHKRTASSMQVRALKALQGGVCAYPSCMHGRHLHAHHVVHWSAGGKTTLDNLVLICAKHHRLLHEGGYSLAIEGGRQVFRNRHGLRVDSAPMRAIGDITHVPFFDARYRGDDPTNSAASRADAIKWLLHH